VESAALDAPTTANAKLRVPPKQSRKRDEVAELRARARAAAAQSKSFIGINIRVGVDTYKALVELAEEYHQPVTVVTRQCIEDGIRKYRDFSDPSLNPFGRPAVGRAAAAVSRDTSILRKLQQARAQHEEEETEEDVLANTIDNLASNFPIGALFPSTPANSIRPLAEPADTTDVVE